MIAVQGFYDNGKIELKIPAPMNRAEVLVIFPEKNVESEKIDGDFVASRFGAAKGQFVSPADIDSANDDIAEMFGVNE